MKKLLFAIAGAAAFSAAATDYDVLGFESYVITEQNAGRVVEKTDTGTGGDSKWDCQGDDASTVKAYDAEFLAPSITGPSQITGANTQYLNLDTNGSELKRLIPSEGQTVAADGTYIDTLVQFTLSESAPTSSDLDGAKLAIWLGVVNNVTNLYVQGNYWDFDGSAPSATSQAYALTGKTIDPGTWYRLTVKAIPNILGEESGMSLPVFQVLVDGTEMTLATSPISADFAQVLADSSMYASADIQTAVTANKLVPSIQSAIGTYGDAVTLTSVGFKGTGALDNFVVTTDDPFPASSAIDFTLTWPAGVTPVSYTIDGGEPVAIDGNTTFPIQVADGAVVAFTFTNADGVTKTMSATASSSVDEIDASTATYVWADYLGDAVAGAYQIDDFADLDMLRKGVAAGLATADETFKQTANIDMTSAGAFAGIGTYAKVPTEGTPFLGTYDGQGYMIANVTRAGGDTQGIFNQVGVSGVIENLVVSNMAVAAETTGEYGFAIVGNAGGGATLRNLTAAGTFSSAEKNSTHNMAGIVVRLCGGATADIATTIDSCTNNATIYGAYTKLGGICAIVQQQTGFTAGKVVFNNCANNGNVVCVRTAAQCAELDDKGKPKLVTGNAGIIGYTSANNVELTGCSGMGTITNTNGANTDKDGALIGWQVSGYTLKDNGGNSAPANTKMIAYYGNVANVTGFKFATDDNGVATTVTTLAKDTTYLLESNVAASETPVFTLAAAGDTIAFNTALGYTFAGTIAAGSGLKVTDATVDTVTTYTASSSATPLNPGQGDGETYATEEAATTAAENVTIAAAAEVATALGETEAANYVTNFEAKAVSNGSGGYTVQVVLKESVEAALQDQADADAGTVADALDAASVTVETVPGFYYSIKYGASLEAMSYRTAGELATGASKALTMPAKPGTSGFYKVVIDIAPSAAVAPAQE